MPAKKQLLPGEAFLHTDGERGEIRTKGIRVVHDFTETIDGVPVRFLFGEAEHGELVCFRIEVGPSPDTHDGRSPVTPMTTTLLRRIQAGSLISTYMFKANQMLRGFTDPHPQLVRSFEVSAVKSRNPGRPRKYDLEHWKKVASVYRGHSGRAKRKAVADYYDLSPRTASNWVAEARKHGALEPYE
jgi:hypothetical protein